jgi:hypothetical protein
VHQRATGRAVEGEAPQLQAGVPDAAADPGSADAGVASWRKERARRRSPPGPLGRNRTPTALGGRWRSVRRMHAEVLHIRRGARTAPVPRHTGRMAPRRAA